MENKLQVLNEISRQRQLMGLSKNRVILNEDGIVRWVSKKLKNMFDNKTIEVDPQTGTVTKYNVGGTDLLPNEFDDLKTVVDDFENMGSSNIYTDYFESLASILQKNQEIRSEIYKKMVKDLLDNIKNSSGAPLFKTDIDFLDFLKRDATRNNIDVETALRTDYLDRMRGTGNFPDDDSHNLIYDLFVEETLAKIAKLNREGTIKADVDLTKSLFNVNNWEDLPNTFYPSDEDFLKSKVTPTLKQSFVDFFTFRLNNKDRVNKLQKYIKLYETVTDSGQKDLISKFLNQEFSDIFFNDRKLYNEMRGWTELLRDEYTDKIDKNTKELLDKVDKLIQDKKWGEIAKLTKNEGTFQKFKETLIDLFTPLRLDELRKSKILEGEVEKQIQNKYLEFFNLKLKNLLPEKRKNWLKSGSQLGWPSNTNKLWMDLTGGNLKLARKKYALDLFRRYIMWSLLWGTLSALLDLLVYLNFHRKSDANDKVKMCMTNIQTKLSGASNDDKVFQQKYEAGELSIKELPDPCGDYGGMVMWGVNYNLAVGKTDDDLELSNRIFMYFLKSIATETYNIFSFDGITDIFPGKIDDIVSKVFEMIHYSSNEGRIDKLVESVENAQEKAKQEVVNQGARLQNIDNTEGLYENNLDGFKKYLEKELGSSDGAEGTKDTFTHDGLTYEFTEEPTKKPLGGFGVVVN